MADTQRRDAWNPGSGSSYDAAIRLSGPDLGRGAFLGVRPTGLDVELDDQWTAHFDLEGRLFAVATPNVQWRRGLSHRAVRFRKRSRDEGGGLERRLLDRSEADQLVERASRRLGRLRDRFGPSSVDSACGRPVDRRILRQIETALDQAVAFDVEAAHRDVVRFEAIYGHIPILPPDQYRSLALMATEGCRFNRCTFCGFYRDETFRARSPEEFRLHVEASVRYHGGSLALRRGIFLGQANALAGPAPWRRQIFEILNERFEFPTEGTGHPPASWWLGSTRRFTEITSFLDALTEDPIDGDQFEELRSLNLARVYVGMETGDAGLLKWLSKPATPERIVETVRAAMRGRVAVGLILLIGAGGERFFDSHVRETIRLLRAMPLGASDAVYLSPIVDAPHTPYGRRAEQDRIEPLSPERLQEQEEQIRAGISPTRRLGGPYVASYDVSHFVY